MENQELNKEYETRVKLQEQTQSKGLEENTKTLLKYGGFNIIEGTIEGTAPMNPAKKARKKIFLEEENKRIEREKLLKRLKVIASFVESKENPMDLVELAVENSQALTENLNQNVREALERTRELEEAYRALALFFANAESEKVSNITFMNADLDKLTDLDDPAFIDAVSDELTQNFDRLDLRENYSILAIPGYLREKKVIDKWARIAHKNKVMLLTDFANLEGADDVISEFEAGKFTGGDPYLSNVMMTCNWLVGREKYNEIGEASDVHVSPSAALAGKVYSTLASQVSAGRKFGALNESDKVVFNLKKSEIADLDKIGIVPMVNEYGKVMAFSAKTLFSGDNLGLQTYSVVRVFDYILKVLMDFLNRRAFENFNPKMKADLQGQIVKFLDSITGPGNLIEKFRIDRFEQDPKQKDRIFLDINITPYFPAKNFMIKLDGQKGDEGTDWNAEYAQK